MEDVRYHISLLAAWRSGPALEWTAGVLATGAIVLFGYTLRVFSRRWDWMTDETGRGE